MIDHAHEMAAFVRVVDAQGFSAAAPALGLTPSAVSKLVTRLEARLGVRLLQRTTRALSLTAEGEAFYAAARRIVGEIAALEAEIGDRRGGREALGVDHPDKRSHLVSVIDHYRISEFGSTVLVDHTGLIPFQEGISLQSLFGGVHVHDPLSLPVPDPDLRCSCSSAAGCRGHRHDPRARPRG